MNTGRTIKDEMGDQTLPLNLVVSGSRAVGGVTNEINNTFRLLDFEEDEESDEE